MTTILREAIKRAKENNDKQRIRDLILLRFGLGMFLFSLIIAFSFIFISLIGRLFI